MDVSENVLPPSSRMKSTLLVFFYPKIKATHSSTKAQLEAYHSYPLHSEVYVNYSFIYALSNVFLA
jgi:hypothetical protein